MITKKKKAALVACSDPISQGRLTDINQVADFLQNQGLDVILPDTFFAQFSMNPALKAKSLMDCFRDPEMEYIFDVSGGDLANAVLPYLDYDAIRNSNAVFYGYSDLTTIINAIIAKTGKGAVNYQIGISCMIMRMKNANTYRRKSCRETSQRTTFHIIFFAVSICRGKSSEEISDVSSNWQGPRIGRTGEETFCCWNPWAVASIR